MMFKAKQRGVNAFDALEFTVVIRAVPEFWHGHASEISSDNTFYKLCTSFTPTRTHYDPPRSFLWGTDPQPQLVIRSLGVLPVNPGGFKISSSQVTKLFPRRNGKDVYAFLWAPCVYLR